MRSRGFTKWEGVPKMAERTILLRKIAVENYGPFVERQEIPLDEDVTVIIGANESGKTLLLKAISVLQGSTNPDVHRISRFAPQEAAVIEGMYSVHDVKFKQRIEELLGIPLALGNRFTVRYEFQRLEGGSPRLERILKVLGKDDKEVVLLHVREQQGGGRTLGGDDRKRSELFKMMPDVQYFSPDTLGKLNEVFSTNVANGETLHKTLFELGGFFELEECEQGNLDLLYPSEKREDCLKEVAARISELALKDWPQTELELHFEVDSEHGQIQVWVKDLTKPVRDRLSERGQGVRTLVHTWLALHYALKNHRHNKKEARPLILIIDEDQFDLSSHLHPPAQRTMMKILTEFARNNGVQIILATHSPFLIDWNRPDRVRVFLRTWNQPGKGVIVLSKPYKSFAEADRLAAYEPVLTSLGLYLGEFPFMGRENLVVEGVSDRMILRALIRKFRAVGLCNLDLNNLSIIPGGGSPHIGYLVRYLVGCNATKAVLVDNDGEGKELAAILEREGVLPNARILQVKPDREATMEDLLPRSLYVRAANECYKNISNLPFPFEEIKEEDLNPDIPVFRALKEAFEDKFGDGAKPDKVKIAATLCDFIHDLPEKKLQSNAYQDARRLLEQIEAAFSGPTPTAPAAPSAP